MRDKVICLSDFMTVRVIFTALIHTLSEATSLGESGLGGCHGAAICHLFNSTEKRLSFLRDSLVFGHVWMDFESDKLGEHRLERIMSVSHLNTTAAFCFFHINNKDYFNFLKDVIH